MAEVFGGQVNGKKFSVERGVPGFCRGQLPAEEDSTNSNVARICSELQVSSGHGEGQHSGTGEGVLSSVDGGVCFWGPLELTYSSV